MVQNNVYLSNASVHLFLQSKLSTCEIDEYLDSNWDEDPAEAILGEAERNDRIEGLISRDYSLSNHIDDIGDDLYHTRWRMSPNKVEEEAGFYGNFEQRDDVSITDGHIADNESDEEIEDTCAGEKNSEDEEINKNLTKLRLTNLPEPPPINTGSQEFESSVEYHISDGIGSDTSCSKRNIAFDTSKTNTKNVDGIVNSLEDTNTSTEGSNGSPRVVLRRKTKRKNRNLSRKPYINSVASLPELAAHENIQEDEEIRRCRSLYEGQGLTRLERNRQQLPRASKTLSFNESSKHYSGLSSQDKTPGGSLSGYGGTKRVRRSRSFVSSSETLRLKREISLSEYIIVEQNSYGFRTKKKSELKKSI